MQGFENIEADKRSQTYPDSHHEPIDTIKSHPASQKLYLHTASKLKIFEIQDQHHDKEDDNTCQIKVFHKIKRRENKKGSY